MRQCIVCAALVCLLVPGPAAASGQFRPQPHAPGIVLAQAGSTGGSIGKRGKSAVGGTTEPVRRTTHSKRKKHNSARHKRSATRVFINPTINGIPLDRCVTWGSNCNEPAASEFCRSKGFARATEWKWSGMKKTIIQSNRQICTSAMSLCGGFTRIVCK